MKGLNKIALVAAIAAASTAQAELVAMDDASMSATTGQAGLTIDVNAAKIDIGEIAYQDQGFLAINGLSITGSDMTSAIDNIRMTVDVVGAADPSGTTPGEIFDLGTGALGASYLAATPSASTLVTAADITVAEVDVNGASTNQNALLSDGDLVIALRGQEGLVDYGLSIDSVQLAESGSTVGSIAAATSGTTTLVSDLNLAGMLGPIDIVIDNGTGGMNISAFFNATGSLNVDFLNTTMGLAVHNSRGAERAVLTLVDGSSVSFAHAQMNISQFDDGAGKSGLAFDLQDFSGDIDLTNITLGAAPSIGNLYITDMKISAETVVYGH